MSNESRKNCFFSEFDDLDQDKMDEKELFRKYRAGKEAEERQKMALSEEEKSKYQYIIDEGKKAEDKIIRQNQGLVHRIASKYPKRNNTDPQDLTQAGNIGLVKAMREFDLERNTRFITFAWKKIQKEIGIEYLKYSPIYIPEKMMSEIVTVRNAARDLSVKSGYEPSREEIADYLNWKPEQVDKVRGYDREVVSLDTPVGEDGMTCILDLLIDDQAVSPEDQVIRNEKEAYVRKVVNSLPARKRDAVRSRYGFDDDIEHSLDEIGVKLDVSTGRSRQIIKKTFQRKHFKEVPHMTTQLAHAPLHFIYISSEAAPELIEEMHKQGFVTTRKRTARRIWNSSEGLNLNKAVKAVSNAYQGTVADATPIAIETDATNSSVYALHREILNSGRYESAFHIAPTKDGDRYDH